MWRDLVALTPPLVVCVAFLIGVAMLLRREMSPEAPGRARRTAAAAGSEVVNYPVRRVLSRHRSARTGRTQDGEID